MWGNYGADMEGIHIYELGTNMNPYKYGGLLGTKSKLAHHRLGSCIPRNVEHFWQKFGYRFLFPSKTSRYMKLSSFISLNENFIHFYLLKGRNVDADSLHNWFWNHTFYCSRNHNRCFTDHFYISIYIYCTQMPLLWSLLFPSFSSQPKTGIISYKFFSLILLQYC
jgi:hypothetical protein